MQLELEDFEIVGISVRTTNQNQQAEKDIGMLWQLFHANDPTARIEYKISEDLYCVYTDYESDYSGAFTTILGYQVKPGTLPPSGLVRKVILRSAYQVFISEGPLPATVQQTWMDIWKSDLKRRYTADFDVYGPHSKNPEKAIVRTFVSIEP
jgi:predicted transcriptional regulator YdeE